MFQVSVRYTRITSLSRHSQKVDGSARRSWRCSRGNSAPIQPRNTRGAYAPALWQSTIKRWTSITGYDTTTFWLTSFTGMWCWNVPRKPTAVDFRHREEGLSGIVAAYCAWGKRRFHSRRKVWLNRGGRGIELTRCKIKREVKSRSREFRVSIMIPCCLFSCGNAVLRDT